MGQSLFIHSYHDLHGGNHRGYTVNRSDPIIDLLRMAEEDESRPNNCNDPSPNSKNIHQEERDKAWLQLTLGNKVDHQTSRSGESMELDLVLGGGGGGCFKPVSPFGTEFGDPCRSVTTYSSNFQHHEINWPIRPIATSSFSSSSWCSSSNIMQLGSYFTRPYGSINVAFSEQSSDFRIINPPKRPQSGIWFMLHASQNQGKEPFLPQIPKSYLRIKDGKMTIRLLMKYLMNKLKLDNELEIEITCRGQKLQPIMTLQYVRDSIWNQRVEFTLLPHSPAIHHLMLLHYGRSS